MENNELKNMIMEERKWTYYPIAINRLSSFFSGMPRIIVVGVDDLGNIKVIKHPKKIK
jgi:hypothetical protein